MISLFTPTHKPDYLPELYTSIANQTYSDWEWIVLLNNGAEYSNADPRVKVVRDDTSNSDVGYLKRKACEYCTGDVLFEMDHDDLLTPDALEECAKAFADPSVDFAYSNSVHVDVRTMTSPLYSEAYGWSYRDFEWCGHKLKEFVSSEPDPQSISRIWFAPNHFRAWRKEFYWRIGGHDLTMKIADDHDLICRTYIHGKMVHVNKPCYIYQIHGENTWLKTAAEIQTEMWKVHDRCVESMAVKWAKERGLMCIDLCGGLDKPSGFISIDKVGGDITADLDETWPIADNSVGVIRAHDAIEHLKSPIHTMNEAHRVLAHGGFFLIRVPSSDGVGAFCDPTHVSFWNKRSFRYYTERHMRRYIEGAGCKCKFQAIRCDNTTLWDNVPYVQADLVSLKQDNHRFYGEYHWHGD